MMKTSPMKIALLAVITLITVSAKAQTEDKTKRVSPPAQTSVTTDDGIKVIIEYSAPQVKGREIWGSLVEYDKVWRTGANEATTFEINKDVVIDGKKLVKGKYALFTIIPKDGDEVTVIINKDPNQWGTYKYKESDDVLRFKVKSKKVADVQEELKFDIQKNGDITFAWEKLRFSFHIRIAVVR